MLGGPAWGRKGLWGPTHPMLCSALLLALQDELSHINARLNMGILGCECGPPIARPVAPRAPGPSRRPSLCSV